VIRDPAAVERLQESLADTEWAGKSASLVLGRCARYADDRDDHRDEQRPDQEQSAVHDTLLIWSSG
jgi:hypothetical protein